MSQNSKRRVYLWLATFAIFQLLLWPTSDYSLTHQLEYLTGYFTVVLLPTVILSIAATYFIEYRWPDQSKQAKTRRAVAKRQRSLNSRLESEGAFKTLQNLGERLIYRIVVPTSLFLDRYFGDVHWVHEHMITVTRRYLVIPIAQAMEYPTTKTGHFLHIIDYLWQDDHATFVFEPAIGILRARKTISKRLSRFNHHSREKVEYIAKGTFLYVNIPKSICGL